MSEERKATEWQVDYLNSKGLSVIDYALAHDPDEIYHAWGEHYGALRHITKIRPVESDQ